MPQQSASLPRPSVVATGAAAVAAGGGGRWNKVHLPDVPDGLLSTLERSSCFEPNTLCPDKVLGEFGELLQGTVPGVVVIDLNPYFTGYDLPRRSRWPEKEPSLLLFYVHHSGERPGTRKENLPIANEPSALESAFRHWTLIAVHMDWASRMFKLVGYDSLGQFMDHDHFATIVTSYILHRVPHFRSLGFEKKTVSVKQKGNDCAFWVMFWMVLLAFDLGRYTDEFDREAFDEYRKRVQLDLLLESMHYCVPMQQFKQLSLTCPPILMLNLKLPGGRFGGARRVIQRGAILEWQSCVYRLVAVINHLVDIMHYTACVRYGDSWFKCDDLGAHIEKVSFPIACTTDYILFYVLDPGAADSVRCASSLLSPSRPVGLTSANVFSPVSTPVRPAAVTPDSAPRVRLLNQRPLDSSSLTSFKRVVFQDLPEPRPLKNIGNSCFVSSSIQCVVACCRAAPTIVGFRGSTA
jgi:hypothetical protein